MNTTVQDNWNKGNRDPYLDRFSPEVVYMVPNMEALIGKDAITNFANAFASKTEIFHRRNHGLVRIRLPPRRICTYDVSRLTSRQGKISQHLEEKTRKKLVVNA